MAINHVEPPPTERDEFDWVWRKWIASFVSTITNSSSLGFATTTTSTTIDKKTVLLVDTSGGAVTVTLPPAAKSDGLCYYIKDTDGGANAVTIDGNASETIDGSTTLVLATARGVAKLICDGSSWHRLSN